MIYIGFWQINRNSNIQSLNVYQASMLHQMQLVNYNKI